MKHFIHIRQQHHKPITWLLIAACLLAGLQTLTIYFVWDLNLILGLMAIPIVFRVKEAGRFRYGYAIPAAICLGLYAFLHMKIFFLLGMGMAVLFIIESRMGRLGPLPLLLIGISSPVLNYLATIFTFPLRLAWSQAAARVIGIFEKDVQVHGNLFVLKGNAFTVDPECLGLNMIVTGLILVCMLLAFAERKQRVNFSLAQLGLTFSLATGLILFANFFRILCLVLFRSMPESLSHEIIGLFCLGAYVIGPIYFWIKWLATKAGPQEEQAIASFCPHALRSISISLGLLLFIFLLNQQWKDLTVPEAFDPLSKIEVADMEKVSIQEGIAHFESDSLILYIKQPTRFWGADHTPAICWMGSGYTFAYVQKQFVAGQQVFVGALKREEHQLFTAWWYDNGEYRTVSQWDWRFRTAKGEAPFFLWNLTAEREEELRETLTAWFTPPPSHPKMSAKAQDILPAMPSDKH
jgi:exosortase N